MKKQFLSFFIMIMSFFMISCVSMENVAYHDEYVVGVNVYPVYYINSYPYYWFDNNWIMVPRYRYTYIRHINSPRHIHAYRPNPYRYMHRPNHRYDRRPNYGVPHTRQPNAGGTHRSNTGNGGARFGGRR